MSLMKHTDLEVHIETSRENVSNMQPTQIAPIIN